MGPLPWNLRQQCSLHNSQCCPLRALFTPQISNSPYLNCLGSDLPLQFQIQQPDTLRQRARHSLLLSPPAYSLKLITQLLQVVWYSESSSFPLKTMCELSKDVNFKNLILERREKKVSRAIWSVHRFSEQIPKMF